MIIHFKKDAPREQITELADQLRAKFFFTDAHTVMITGSSIKNLPDEISHLIEKEWTFSSDIQLASNHYREKQTVDIAGVKIGEGNSTTLVSGPCSVENEEQIVASAQFLAGKGLKFIRGGCYKPRTSPYSFQGLGKKGLEMLRDAADSNGLRVITEARDATHIDDVLEYADVVQVGTKAMYDHGILNACGQSGKPVLLKRGFGSTLQEFVQAAEFILSAGNSNVMLCERGIRTFEDKTRFTLDLTAVAWLKEHVNLPVFIDPSHAMGYAYGVPGLARAAMAMGVDGLLIESHPDPANALSDAAQQLTFEELNDLKEELERVGRAVGRGLV